MKLRRSVSFLLVILTAMIVISLAWAQGGGFNKPVFDDTMEGAGKAVRVVLGGIIAGDMGKVSTQAQAIASAAGKVREMQPPHNAEKIDEFKAHADTLAARAKRVVAAANVKNDGLVAREFGGMVETCVGCHAVFRKE